MSNIPNPAHLGLAKHLAPEGLIAIAWVGVVVAFLFVSARTWIRFYKVERLAWDDYWIYFAWVLLMVNAILQTFQMPHLYYLAHASAGMVPVDEKLFYHGNVYVRYEFALIGIFWTILWSVKASFLSLFWQLFNGLPVYKRWWFVVAVFCFLAYAGCWISSILNCHPVPAYFKFGQCLKAIDRQGTTISISYSTAADIVTDIMMMAMPFNLLHSIRITNKQKVGLATVFGLATIIIIAAIVRAIEITSKARTDAPLLALMSIIESTVSVIVGCLPPFKTLFSVRSTSHPYKSSVARSNSVPLNLQDDAYKVLARGGKGAHSDTESQLDMFRQDDTDMIFEEHKGEERIIHVKRVFSVSSS